MTTIAQPLNAMRAAGDPTWKNARAGGMGFTPSPVTAGLTTEN